MDIVPECAATVKLTSRMESLRLDKYYEFNAGRLPASVGFSVLLNYSNLDPNHDPSDPSSSIVQLVQMEGQPIRHRFEGPL